MKKVPSGTREALLREVYSSFVLVEWGKTIAIIAFDYFSREECVYFGEKSHKIIREWSCKSACSWWWDAYVWLLARTIYNLFGPYAQSKGVELKNVNKDIPVWFELDS